jgi:hypothetical protein
MPDSIIRIISGTVILAACATMAFWPRLVSTRISGLQRENRLWVRMAGLLGLLWVALTIIGWFLHGNPNITPRMWNLLKTIRGLPMGMMFGLLLALCTRKRESGQDK